MKLTYDPRKNVPVEDKSPWNEYSLNVIFVVTGNAKHILGENTAVWYLTRETVKVYP